jgi:Peptidase family M50
MQAVSCMQHRSVRQRPAGCLHPPVRSPASRHQRIHLQDADQQRCIHHLRSRAQHCAAKRRGEDSDLPKSDVEPAQPADRRREDWLTPSGSPILLSTFFAAGFGGLLGLFPDTSGATGALTAIGILCAIVTFHELGHFSAARLQGIHVSKFSVGFGPTLLSFQPGEVEYALRALPLGGFVAFPDNDEDCPYPKDDPNLLKNRPVLDRMIVTAAGAAGRPRVHTFVASGSPCEFRTHASLLNRRMRF